MNGYNAGFNSCSSYESPAPQPYAQYEQSSPQSATSNPQECKGYFNDAGEFVSNFVPGAKIVGKVAGEVLCKPN
jgi:hypothetical protein